MRPLLVGLSLLILTVSSLIAGNVRISDRNPAAIRQVVTNGSQVTLHLQFVNQGLPGFRCICPENTLANQVRQNNGNFQVNTTREWVEANHPELLQDENYLADRYQNSGELVLLYNADLNLVSDGTLAGISEIEMSGGETVTGNYSYAPEDAFRLDAPVTAEFNEGGSEETGSQGTDDFVPAEDDFEIRPPSTEDETPEEPAFGDNDTPAPSDNNGLIEDQMSEDSDSDSTHGKEPQDLRSKEISISDRNPAVIVSGVIKGDVAVLNMQFVNSSLPTYRCICPDNAFSSQVNENNGQFEVYTKAAWVKENLPEVFEDKAAIGNKFRESSNVPVFMGSVSLQYSGMSELRSIELGSGSVQWVQYSRASEDAFSLGEFKPFQIMTGGKPSGSGASADLTQGQEPIHKFSLPNDNPAALRFIEEGEDGWKTLHLQIVNKQLMLARCICPLTQVHGAINEARGNFTVKVAPEMANKILGDVSNETLAQKWQEDRIYIITGTVLATAVNDGVVQAYLGTDGQIQEGTYAYAREDAFEFDGIMSDSYSVEGESGEQTGADPFFDGLNFDN